MRRLSEQLNIRTDKETKEFFTEWCKTSNRTLHELMVIYKEALEAGFCNPSFSKTFMNDYIKNTKEML
jgi:hypothetical protein